MRFSFYYGNHFTMATFSAITGLEHFTSIFVFLFVWIVVYAVLLLTKILGENKFVHALVGLLLAIFVLLSPLATDIVADIAPLAALAFLFMILVAAATKMLGGGVEEFPALKGVFLVVFMLIILIVAGVKLRENIDVPSSAQTDLSKTVNLIFHPTFLGVVLVLAIAVFTIALLASRST